jgi:hypothetical protein
MIYKIINGVVCRPTSQQEAILKSRIRKEYNKYPTEQKRVRADEKIAPPKVAYC